MASARNDKSGRTDHPGSSEDAPPARRRAIRSPLAIVLFLACLAGALAADLVTKHVVFETLLSDPRHQARARTLRGTTIDGRRTTTREILAIFKTGTWAGVRFKLQTNKGIVFGTELHKSQKTHRMIVAAATILTVTLAFLFFATSEARAWSVHAALGCILGGALGNLYDRLFSIVTVPGFAPAEYQVRDFIDCAQLYYPWVFNVADILLVVGVGMLILHWIRTGRRRPTRGQAGSGASDPSRTR